MSQSYDLFCRWKHVKKIQSDNAGAIALGVTRATVSTWKQGKNAEIQYIEQMALDIGDSPETWCALVMAERSNSEAEKAAWKRIAQKLATVAMALFLFVGAALPDRAVASPISVAHHDIHYAQLDAAGCGLRIVRLAMAAALDRLLLACSVPEQGRDCSMSQIDPHDRTELTGQWAGFGFQRGHMYTPEGHSLEPGDMTWWSLTCNIAREWRLMMAEARPSAQRDPARALKPLCRNGSSVINLRDAIQERRERRLAKVVVGTAAAASNVVPLRRGPKRDKRG